MKRLVPFLFLFFSSCMHHQNQQNELACIQMVDRNGITETISTKTRLSSYNKTDFLATQPYRQILRIYKKNPEGKIPSVLTTYHDNGLLHQYLEVQDARACGLYREWHPNGQIKIEATIMEGPADLSSFSQKQWLFDGESHIWDGEGYLLATIPYQKGMLEGVATYYYPNGKIEKTIPYHQNEIEGDVIEYHENEQILCKMQYQKGCLHGDKEGYLENQNLSYIETYQHGLLEHGQYYDSSNQLCSSIVKGEGTRCLLKNGKVFQTISYHKGKAEGQVKFWNEQGDLTQLYHMYNGKKEGQEVLYYLPEEIDSSYQKKSLEKLSLHWQNNMIHGTIKSWYPNGVQESQKEFCKNKKNGSCVCWYRDGSLMLVEEYEDDLLKEGTYYQIATQKRISSIKNGNGTASLFHHNGELLQKVKYEQGRPSEE